MIEEEGHVSTSELPQRIDHDAPVFVISVAAQLAGMHPQTLRTYDRMGLVSPRRTAGRGRRYSARNIAQLRLIQRLSQDEGINLEGIRRILVMQDEIEELRARVSDLSELLAVARTAPPGVRVFTADPRGDVHLGGMPRRRPAPRAITSR
jgi:MerR family transcriptional regulator/heat shock protein HspR